MTYHAQIRNDVPETCPVINKAIRQVRDACKAVDGAKSTMDAEALYDRCQTAEWELRGVEDAFEELRTANGKLRDIACEALARIDELESKMPEPTP